MNVLPKCNVFTKCMQFPSGPEERIRLPGAGVADVCRLP